MLTIRTADHLNDSTTIIEHNCAMALETEGKVLDKQAAELGVKGLFDRPQFGFYPSYARAILPTYNASESGIKRFLYISIAYH